MRVKLGAVGVFCLFYSALSTPCCAGAYFNLSESGVVMVARANSICCEAGCPRVATYRGRCAEHSREYERKQRNSVATKINERDTREVRKRFVQRWREIYGDWCPGYKRPGHRARDLTAQHRHALSDGGDPSQPLTVLCRPCNSRHGADVLAARNRRF